MRNIYLLITAILLGLSASAQTWTGATNTDWNTASNWSPAAVPISTGNVIIPGSLGNYPVLATNVTINSINMQAGSKLDFNGHTLDILSVNTYNYFIGASLNNSNVNTDIVINITGGVGYTNYLRSMTTNDNITFNLSGGSTFFDADGGGTANTYNGNVTFNISSGLTFYLSHLAASQYKGDLTINRTITGGPSILFNAGGNVSGNFRFTNNLDGAVVLGNLSNITDVTGKVDITVNQGTPDLFHLYNFKNHSSGGVINVQNSSGFEVEKDTLKLNSVSVTGYRGGNYGYFLNNDITGNLTLADDASYSNGYATYLRSNLITGTSNFTSNGSNTFWEADNGGTGNHFTGDVSYTITGKAILYISQGATSTYDGNLSISRPGAGPTVAFNSGGIIGGNFSFTNNTMGDATFGNTATLTSVGGKLNIAINDTLPGYFQLYRIINQTPGGTINVQNSYGFLVQEDTLKVNSLSLTGYRGNNYAYFLNNDITGNLTLADDASYSTGYGTYLRSNLITGTSNFTSNGSNTFWEADNGGSGNHFVGDVSYNITGKAILYISHGATSTYDGNLSISRLGAGPTVAFNSGGMIGGNFSFTNNTMGDATFGNTATLTSVGGKLNIAINDTLPGYFQLYRIINQTPGGTINVQNSYGFLVQEDKLKVNSLSLTGYRGNNYAYFLNNDITGNLTLADDASYSTGYGTYLRTNNIVGDATFTKNGTNAFIDADAGGTGNSYSGNVTFNKNAIGAMSVGAADTTSIGGGLSLNNSSIALNLIQFTGNNDGIVQQAGSTPITIPTLIMNKGGKAKITLMDSVIVTNNLNLNSGIIATGVNSNLVLPVNMTYLGGSDSSYVDGPMLKIGNNAFTFPVGQNNAYAPISITAPGSITDQFLAQYIHMHPESGGYDTAMKAGTLDHVSRSEYWILNRTAGTSNVSVTLSYDTLRRSGRVINPSQLRVSRWNGTLWADEGNGGTTGTPAMGTVISGAAVTSFGPFTLASTTAQNTLPVTLVSFTATEQNGVVTLLWKTENEINFSHYEVERSSNVNAFSEVLSKVARNQGSESLYSGTDLPNATGVFYYRLKMVDKDGKIAYSNIVSVKIKSTLSITLSPNPVRDRMIVNGLAVGSTVRIVDVSGKLVITIVATSSTNQTIDIPKLQSGMYMLQVLKDNSMQTVSFIKD
jgi:hypothetical protein